MKELIMPTTKTKTSSNKKSLIKDGGKFDAYDASKRPEKPKPFNTKIGLKKKEAPKSSAGFYIFAMAFVGILLFLLFSGSEQDFNQKRSNSGKSFSGFSNFLPKR